MPSLWEFASTLYQQPGVAATCLALQDQRGADVCLLLAALWLERRGCAASPVRCAALTELAGNWQDGVTTPLRQLRRAWKAQALEDAQLAGLRSQLADLELQAERILLQRLQALSHDWPEDCPGSDWLNAWLGAQAGDSAALQHLREAARGLPRAGQPHS